MAKQLPSRLVNVGSVPNAKRQTPNAKRQPPHRRTQPVGTDHQVEGFSAAPAEAHRHRVAMVYQTRDRVIEESRIPILSSTCAAAPRTSMACPPMRRVSSRSTTVTVKPWRSSQYARVSPATPAPQIRTAATGSHRPRCVCRARWRELPMGSAVSGLSVTTEPTMSVTAYHCLAFRRAMTGGRSKTVTIPGSASTTYGIAFTAGCAV